MEKYLHRYLISEILLLALIETGLYLGWSDLIVQILMYTAILINTGMAVYHYYHLSMRGRKNGNGTLAPSPEGLATSGRTETDKKYVVLALFTTAAADFFMTLICIPDTFLPGVLLFCLVQIFYGMYLAPDRKWFLIRAVIYAAGLMFLRTVNMLNVINAAGMLDLTLLLINAILAWTVVRDRTPRLFRIGITLFLCGDLIITFRSLTSGTVQNILNLLEWVFYLPSQVAITLSLRN